MKKHLILPVAGESSRYNTELPKYFLEHPNGNRMLTESISGINISSFDSILIIGLKEHEDRFSALSICSSEISKVYNYHNVSFVLLDRKTKNQPETVYLGIEKVIPDNDGILIKDCDGFYTCNNANYNRNNVSVGNLNTIGYLNAGNKSYVEMNDNFTIGNIVEKQVISNLFCVGGYYFKHSGDFKESYKKLMRCENLYVSHIIYNLLTEGKHFFINIVDDYVDWGTQNDWIRYKTLISEQKSIVIDVDNTLCFSSDSPYIDRKPNQEIISKLREYQKNGYYIIIETSRNMKTFKKNVGLINVDTLPTLMSWLKKYDVPYNEIYIGKPWEGEKGFRVDNSTIRPDEFLTLSEKKIQELLYG